MVKTMKSEGKKNLLLKSI